MFKFIIDIEPNQLLVDLKETLIQSTANKDSQPPNTHSAAAGLLRTIESKSPSQNCNRTVSTVRSATHSPSCDIVKLSPISLSNITAVGDNSNEKAAVVVPNDVRPFSALYDIICKEKEIENIMSNALQTEQLLSLNMGLTDQDVPVVERRRSAVTNDDQISTSTTETEQFLDRINHSPSTGRNNSKYTVAYKDYHRSDCDDRKEQPDLRGSARGTDARYSILVILFVVDRSDLTVPYDERTSRNN